MNFCWHNNEDRRQKRRELRVTVLSYESEFEDASENEINEPLNVTIREFDDTTTYFWCDGHSTSISACGV